MNKMNSAQEANSERHYMVLVVAIVFGLAGVYVRFLGEASYLSWIANILLIIGVIIGLRTVFAIMK